MAKNNAITRMREIETEQNVQEMMDDLALTKDLIVGGGRASHGASALFNIAGVGLAAVAGPVAPAVAALTSVVVNGTNAASDYLKSHDKSFFGPSTAYTGTISTLKSQLREAAQARSVPMPEGLEQDLDRFGDNARKIVTGRRLNLGLQFGTAAAAAAAMAFLPVSLPVAATAVLGAVCGQNVLYNIWGMGSGTKQAVDESLDSARRKVDAMMKGPA